MLQSTPSDTRALRVLLGIDLVGSTKIAAEVGDSAWAAVCSDVDLLARSLRSDGSLLLERTDGFLIAFERPAPALAFALEWHRKLGAVGAAHGLQLAARAGIHLGEVALRENAPEDVAAGEKPVELDGLALATCARLTSLGLAGQTLLTREAFDIARRGAMLEEGIPPELLWLAHGEYLFEGLDEPVEVFEAGREGEAPLAPPPDSHKAKRAVWQSDEALLGWRPAAGLEVPRRENWSLEERLGVGGYGEVWLATHQKTRARRVYKFCFEAAKLRTLKREVNLFRLLHEALGGRDDIQRVIDWNFDTAPYFIESEHAEGPTLKQLAERDGGLAGIPLATRVELVAAVADAIAAAHSIGVLHKDVKPANIVVRCVQPPAVTVLDFGIGELIERSALRDLGITEIQVTTEPAAFTSTSGAGTRLYLAPEFFENKPATVLRDVYALGVLLFQICIGDFSRAYAESLLDEIPDPLLRQDIAACAHGNPDRRLASPRELAIRLRSLHQRREQAARDESASLALQRSERRRKLGTAAIAVSIILLVGVGFLWRAYRDAAAATLVAKQRYEVAAESLTFIVGRTIHYLFNHPDSQKYISRVLEDVDSRVSILESLAASDEDRLDVARLHLAIGAHLRALQFHKLAVNHFSQAAPVMTELLGAAAPEVIRVRSVLAEARAQAGDAEGALRDFRDNLAAAKAQQGDRSSLTSLACADLGLHLLSMDRAGEAEPHLAEARAIQAMMGTQGGDRCFNSSGDAMHDSGALIQGVHWPPAAGGRIECDIYIESNPDGCWVGVGIYFGHAGPPSHSRSPGQLYGFSATMQGKACWANDGIERPRITTWASAALAAGGTAVHHLDHDLETMGDRWIQLTIEIDSSGHFHIYTDGEHLWSSDGPILIPEGPNSVWIQGRSSVWGDALVDNLRFYEYEEGGSDTTAKLVYSNDFDSLEGLILFGDPLPLLAPRP